MKKSMIAIAAMVASSVAMAEGPSWTYVEAGYLRQDSFGSDDSEGYIVTGSFEFATKWHIRGSYEDFESFGEDGDGYNIVLGGHPALTDRTDLVFEVGYFDFEEDGGFEEDGITVSAGLRTMLADNVDVWGLISSTTGDASFSGSDEDFTDLGLSIGGQYLFTDTLGVGVDYNESQQKANFFIRGSF